jgi:hypothetical protein
MHSNFNPPPEPKQPPVFSVVCQLDYDDLENDEGYDVEGVRATCTRCGHQVESFGTHEGSIKRCLVLMRQECPKKENNYYLRSRKR